MTSASDIKRPRVMILVGSARTPSYTRALGDEVGRLLTASGATVTRWDAQHPMLPIADPAYHTSASTHPDPEVRRLDDEARRADAFVFATPVYHNSYSGVLKNTIDLLNSEPHFRGKPVGLVSHGGDRSTQAVDHLRVVTRGLSAVGTPTHVCTRRADFTEHDGGYAVTDPLILERVRRFAEELVALAVMLRPLRDPDAVRRLLSSVAPGNR